MRNLFNIFIILSTFFNSNLIFAKPGEMNKKVSKLKEKKEMVLAAGIDFEPKKMSLRIKVNKNKAGEQTLVEEFTVYNKTDESILVRPVIYEFNPDEFGVNQYKKSVANIKDPSLSLTDYMIYPKETISLNPKEKKKVAIQFKLNTSIIGTKYAMITFEKVQNLVSTNQKQGIKASSFSFELKVLGVVVVDVVGSGKMSIEQKTPVVTENQLIVDVQNTGNHILEMPQLEAVLFDSNMKLIEKFSLQMKQKGSLINTKKKRFSHFFNQKYPKGKYKLFTHFKANSGVFFDTAKFDLEL